MYRIALGIEYDGTFFHGWQRQASIPSIQEAIEKALSKVANHTINTFCAGRTDAGVHATEQVVHFDTTVHRDPYSWIAGANALLNPAIRVLWAVEVAPHFNARRSATSRRYRYVIYNHAVRPSLLRHYVSWQYRKLDIKLMIEGSRYWIGEHDFTSFRAEGCQSLSPIRQMKTIEIMRIGHRVIIDFIANAFLHHMVRNMVGTLSKIGSGIMSPEWAKEVLDARSRQAAGITAEPQGLYLCKVNYPSEFGLPELEVGPWFLNLPEKELQK